MFLCSLLTNNIIARYILTKKYNENIEDLKKQFLYYSPYVFLIISIYPLVNNDGIKLWSLVIALIFLILGLLNSNALSPLNLLWMKFGILLGKTISPIVMGVIFMFVYL